MVDRSKWVVRFGLGSIRAGSKYINLGKVKNHIETWDDLLARLRNVFTTPETMAEFLARPKDGLQGQDALKAVNGFLIGCPCKDESRRYQNLLPRTLIAFDMDTLTPAGLTKLHANDHPLADYVWFAHTTRKHTAAKPRLRFFILLKSPVPTDKYEAVSRFLAKMIDPKLEWTDAVSFRATQLMYLPTKSSDGEFECFEGPGEKLVDWKHLFERLTARGIDPNDARNWPRKAEENAVRQRATKAEDPWEKPGLIGSFCRSYPIEELITEHLSDYYVPGDANSSDPRYSAVGSSTSNGLVVYEDGKFCTSHHATDALAGSSANAWDFARVVKFGDLDDPNHEQTDVTKLASYKAMVSWARSLPLVQEDMLNHQIVAEEAFDEEDGFEDAPEPEDEKGDEEFFDGPEAAPLDFDLDEDERAMLGLAPKRTPLDGQIIPPGRPTKPPEDWRTFLVKDEKLQIENNLPNIVTIMRFDPRWFGKVRYNELAERPVITKPVKFKDKPWPNIIVQDERNGDVLQDHHRAVFRAVMESGQGTGRGKGGYGLSSVSQVNLSDGIDAACRHDPFHPVKVFLGEVCKWNGTPVLATMLQRYLGVEDSPFVREAFTLMMVAAVARTFEPGHKFDHTLIIQGKQGAGKSTFLKYLGKIEWHREFDIGFDDPQKIAEKLYGAVIVEQGEMSGFRKAEMEDFKQFMSATETVVRMAYGREAKVFKRRCVIFGTTNDEAPLKDTSGNRRIWFVRSTNEEESGIADLDALKADVDQCWHEAYHIYLRMRAAQPHGDLPLFLGKEARRISAAENDAATAATEFSMMADELRAWADMPVTKMEARGGDTEKPLPDDDEMVLRSRFTPRDGWTEGLDQDGRHLNREVWRYKAAMLHLKNEWIWEKNRRMIDGQRGLWIVRKDATEREIHLGFMDRPPPDIEDLIG